MEEGGVRRDVDIEVNHPARVGSWRIYQVSYDIAGARWSDTSVLECVRDPWYGAAHVALWLLLASGVVMFVTAGGRRVARAYDGDKGADGAGDMNGADGAVSHKAAAARRRGRGKRGETMTTWDQLLWYAAVAAACWVAGAVAAYRTKRTWVPWRCRSAARPYSSPS